jgi:MFS family permease
MLGPLLIAMVLYFKGSYQQGFALLLIPAIFALTLLFFARWLYPQPQKLAVKQIDLDAQGISLPFWIYLSGASLVAAGYADFPLIAYHFEKTAVLSSAMIPLIYAMAMGVNVIAAPLLGHFYDRKGFVVLMFITIFTCLFAPFIFFGNFKMIVIGVILWSIGMGAHDSLMRAIVANMVPIAKRSSAYGIFNMGYGVFWFLGSVLMGVLYDISIPLLVAFSVVIQLAALPLLWVVRKNMLHKKQS